MNLHKPSHWAVLLAVGCNAQLSPIADHAPTAGTGGASGENVSGGAGGAGSEGVAGSTNSAGRSPIDALAGMAGVAEGTGGYSEGGGGTGGDSVSQQYGALGQPCFPAQIVYQLGGYPAQAFVETLADCNSGLFCGAQAKCAAETDCQQASGRCVIREVQFDEDFFVYRNLDRYQNTGIVALAANDTHVYWLEYGTRDALRNYRHDGALMSYRIADGETTAVALGLNGPKYLGLTPTYAYFLVVANDAPYETRLQRVPLAGGNAEAIAIPPLNPQLENLGFSFASVQSQAFWDAGAGVYRMSDSDSVPTLFFEQTVNYLTADATDVFYLPSDAFKVMLTPINNASPKDLGTISKSPIALYGDNIYALDRDESTTDTAFLARAPKSGGLLERLRPLGVISPKKLQVVGDRYFFDGDFFDEQKPFARGILTASFVDDGHPLRLAELPLDTLGTIAWVATSEALYFSDGRKLKKRPLPVP